MNARPYSIPLLAFVLAACSGSELSRGPAPFTNLLPQVVQKGKGAQWVRFTPHTAGALYSAIVLGPDGNLWFIDENAASLVRMSMSGAIKEFSLSGIVTGNAVSMTVGADKNFYIGDESTSIVRVTEKGKAQVFSIPSGDNTAIDGLALGPDGNVWFAEFNHIGKITPSGKITEFAYPSGFTTNQYGGVTAGSDGNVWFAESSANAIGRIVPSSGKITMFTISTQCTPAPVVLAKDNNVWFACLASTPLLGSITPKGKISTFAIGGTFNSNETEQFCSRGPDGEPWCASGNNGIIFRVNTKPHTVTTFTPPLGSGSRPDALAAGADGNVWVDTVGAEIDVLVENPMTVTPNSLTFTGIGQSKTLSVTENGVSSWSAKSSNTGVATVAQGHSKSSFKVTSVGKGSCKVTISDGTGNSVAVKVSVK
jgi:streptogramin lyase